MAGESALGRWPNPTGTRSAAQDRFSSFLLIRLFCWIWERPTAKRQTWESSACSAVRSGTPLVHQVYGDIYKDEHAWENAAAHYYRALEQDPHWQGAHFGLGEIALRREKLDIAAQEYHRELEINPGSAAALARLGRNSDAGG